MSEDISGSNLFKMNCNVYGKGEKTILAFHGFGQDAGQYRIFGEYFGEKYTFHSFDLPFHGENVNNNFKDVISTAVLQKFFSKYLMVNRIDKFGIIGYSIGAKFALNLVNFFPDRISGIMLIAPDGLKINFWYRVATGSLATRHVFRYFMDHPGLFFGFTNLMTGAGLIHRSVSRFVQSQMGTREQREKVYQTWTKFRKLNLDLKLLEKSVRDHKIPIEIILGEKDRIIKQKDIKPLLPRLPGADITSLPVGHHKLIEDTAEYFRENGLYLYTLQ